jgi:MFS family permease
MTAALSMVLIDETVVSVALPAIQQHLHMSPSGRQWPVNAYLLALAACVTVGGRLGELAGQARMFRPSAVVFVAASAGCGLAPVRGVDHRSAGRAEAGRGRDDSGLRGDVITAFSGASGAAPWAATQGARRPLALGPLANGLLTQTISWRAVFWVNLPIGPAILALARQTLPADDPEWGA